MPGMEIYGNAEDSGWARFNSSYDAAVKAVVRNPASILSDEERQSAFEAFGFPKSDREAILSARTEYLAEQALSGTADS